MVWTINDTHILKRAWQLAVGVSLGRPEAWFTDHLLGTGGPMLRTRTHSPCPGATMPPSQQADTEHLLCAGLMQGPGHLPLRHSFSKHSECTYCVQGLKKGLPALGTLVAGVCRMVWKGSRQTVTPSSWVWVLPPHHHFAFFLSFRHQQQQTACSSPAQTPHPLYFCCCFLPLTLPCCLCCPLSLLLRLSAGSTFPRKFA